MNIFQKIFDAIKNFVQRPGMKTFLQKYEETALVLITELAINHSGEGLHAWRDEAFDAIKQATGATKDNWVSVLLHLAYEAYLANKDSKEVTPSATPVG